MPTAILRIVVFLLTALAAAAQNRPAIPRLADGKPNLQGIWHPQTTAWADYEDHVAGNGMLAGKSVLVGRGSIPYLPAALAVRNENRKNRVNADPYRKCWLPGVPRMMTLDYPFQIFQSRDSVGMAFEWQTVYRLIHLDVTKHPEDYDSWMGDSRGRWEGDTLVVDVADHNNNTWLDMSGNYHSDALHVVERYTMSDADTIQYEATLEDPKVFAKPWSIRFAFKRRLDRDRLFEYVCTAEFEEENGLFEREVRTWYPGDGSPIPSIPASTWNSPKIPAVAGWKRTPDGKPDLNGFYVPDGGGANQGLEKRAQVATSLFPAGRGIIVDPPDGLFPMRPWALEERVSRLLPERGYDDPTAHCFPSGVPRAMYVPASFQFIQTPEYLAIFHERTSWRIIDLKRTQHLPDNLRLWQGDSIGHWGGDTLVIETTNLNGKTWLSEGGEIVSHAERVIERITPSSLTKLAYEATIYDPIVYTKPWTISLPFDKQSKYELLEGACREEEHALPHLKAIKDAARKK